MLNAELIIQSVETVMAATHVDENAALQLLAQSAQSKGEGTDNDSIVDHAIQIGNAPNN